MGRSVANRLTLTCEACGKGYEKLPSQRRKHDYCSQECYHKHKATHRPPRKVLHLTCGHCGQSFERFKGSERENTFCSRECYWKSSYRAKLVADNNAKRNPRAKVTEPCGNCQKAVTRFVSSRGNALFCDRDCHNEYRRSRQTRRVTDHGYVIMFVGKGYPGATKAGQVMEHRKVMQDVLGRALVKHENVHHINGSRADNRIENLELWSTSQPQGQRVEDKIRWAKEFISLYERGSEVSYEHVP